MGWHAARPAPHVLTLVGGLATLVGYVSDWRDRGDSLDGTGGLADWRTADGTGTELWPLMALAVVGFAAVWAGRSSVAATIVLVGGVVTTLLVGVHLVRVLAVPGRADTPALELSVLLLVVGLGTVVAGGVRAVFSSMVRQQDERALSR